MRTRDFVNFIKRRERHREAKDHGWGKYYNRRHDPIIDEYRFCNVRRNDDRVTKWVFKELMFPNVAEDHLWFMLTVARLFNNEPTLRAIGDMILPFKPEPMRRTLHKRAAAGEKNFNAAYIVSTNGRSMDKVDYVIDLVLKPLWERRKPISQMMCGPSLDVAHQTLMAEQGIGSFMAAQVLADLKYAHPTRWHDFHTFAASGPGSKRGLNRVMGYDTDSPWREEHFRKVLLELRDATNMRLEMEALTAQDVQNCLCEFDKYERARLGEGRPKQKYTPHKEK